MSEEVGVTIINCRVDNPRCVYVMMPQGGDCTFVNNRIIYYDPIFDHIGGDCTFVNNRIIYYDPIFDHIGQGMVPPA